MNEKPTPEGLLYRYHNDRLFHELVDQLCLSKFLPERDRIRRECDEALASAQQLKKEREDAGGLFGRIGLLAREYMGISDNAPTSECIDAIQTALIALKLRSDRIDRAVDASIVTLLERFQAGEATLLFTAQAIELKLTAELAALRRDGERMEWLEKNITGWTFDNFTVDTASDISTLRSAIDAAQKGDKP